MESLANAMKHLQERIKKYQTSQAVRSDGSNHEKQYDCPKCKDEEGFIVKNDDGVESWRWCQCRDKKRIARLLKSSQITDEFRKKTFKTFEYQDRPDAIKEALKKTYAYFRNFENVMKEPNNGICLLGRPGTGKTHLLMALSNALLRKGVEVVYFPYVEGLEQIKEDMTKDGVNKDRFEKLKQTQVLFIDDLFKGSRSDYDLRKMFEVINYRYMEKQPVLISSELSIGEMIAIDEAIGSRINEMCQHFRVELKGGPELNYRLKEDKHGA